MGKGITAKWPIEELRSLFFVSFFWGGRSTLRPPLVAVMSRGGSQRPGAVHKPPWSNQGYPGLPRSQGEDASNTAILEVEATSDPPTGPPVPRSSMFLFGINRLNIQLGLFVWNGGALQIDG